MTARVVKFSELPKFRAHTPFRFKFEQWVSEFFQIIADGTMPAVLSWVGSVVVALISVRLLRWIGISDLANDEGLSALANTAASLLWLAVVFAFVIVFGAFNAARRIRKLGRWDGNTFLFLDPVPIDVWNATHEKNGTRVAFRIPSAPKHSVARCVLRNPSSSALLQACAQGPFSYIQGWRTMIGNAAWPSFERGDLFVAFRIGNEHEGFVEWFLPDNALPTQLRLYLFSFEIQPPGHQDPQKYFHLHVSQPAHNVDFYVRE